MIKEACIESFEEAILAEKYGANRIELCSNIILDGLTPKQELVNKIINSITIPLNVMIRPRSGNFNYSENELSQMGEDINFCKSIGVSGVVFGILNKNLNIDIPAIKRLALIARPLKITFHKAIDKVPKPLKALEALFKIHGITSVLSSGKKESAIKGFELLKKMIDKAKTQLTIIPAGKITYKNIDEIHQLIGANEYHGRNIVTNFN